MSDPTCYIEVTYTRPDIYTVDRYIEEIIGRRADFSGYGRRGRDIGFDYVRRTAAERAADKLRRHGYKVRVISYD